MKPVIAGLIGTVIGAGIGFGAGYIIAKKQQIKRNDEDLAKMEEYYKDKYGKTEKDILREKAQEPHNAPRTHEKPSEEALKLSEHKFTTFDRITPVKAPVSDYAAKYKITREEDDGPEIPEGETPYIPGDIEDELAAEYNHMVIISPDEYDSDMEYDKTELTYWQADEIFTDPYGKQIPWEIMNPDMVGRENLEHFGVTGEEGVLFVRDDDNLSDYKIYLEESSYEGSTN